MDETTVESTAPLDASDGVRPSFLKEEQDGGSLKGSQGSSSEESSVDEKDGKKRERGDFVPPWRLFRFADPLDALLIFLGTVGAIGIGAALPGHMLLFGTILNNMISYQTLSRELVPNLLYAQQNCTTPGALTEASENGTDNGPVGHFCAPSQGDPASNATVVNPYDTTIAGLSNALFGPPAALPSDYSTRLFDLSLTLNDNHAVMECSDEVKATIILNDRMRGNMSLIQPLDDAFFQTMTYYSLVYFGVAILALLFAYAQSSFWNTAAYRQGFRIRHRFFASLMHQDISWYDTIKSGTLPTRLADDVEKIQSGTGEKIGLFLQYFTTFLLGYLVGFVQGWKLTLVIISIVPLLLVLAVILTTVVAKLVKFEQKNYATAGAIADEVLSAIRTVAAFGGEDRAVDRYGQELVRARRVGILKSFLVASLVGLLFLVLFSCYALAFGYGSVLIANCENMAGDVVTVFLSVLIGTFSLGNALPELETFASAMGAASFIYKAIDRVPEIDSRSEAGEKADELKGNIEFKGVQFNYPARPEVEVLTNINFTARVGQTLALVGPSGCGKSTVIQLLQRFYDPGQGQILIDGKDMRNYNLKWLREQMGIVSQEPNLFAATIAENIRYGREGVTQKEIEAAAKASNAHDFIMSLPEKYETLVGSRGTQMSGGQKQRIAIARALVRDPKILLLDEATSALDNESEAIVQAALDKARMGRTTIVIAHRLSTIRTANVIAGIKGGQVVEQGTHNELMQQNGLYCELVTAQTSEQEAEQSDDQLAGFKAALERPKKLPMKKHHKKRGPHAAGTPTTPYTPGQTPFSPSGSTPYTPGHARYTPSGSTPYSPDKDEQEVQEEKVSFAQMDTQDEDPFPSHPRPSSGTPMIEYKGEGPEDVGPTQRHKSMGVSRFMSKIRFKKKEEEDEELPSVPWLELLKLNLPDWYLVIPGVLAAGAIGALFPCLALIFSGALEAFGSLDRDVVVEGGLTYSLAFLGIAIGAGALQFIQAFALGVAGERLTKRLRLRAFKSMVKQDIAWFDDRRHAPGALTTRLAVDATEVKGATGLRFGTTLQVLVGVTVAIIVAFLASWQLSLLVVSLMPFVAIAGYFQVQLQRGRALKNKERFESTGQISTESIENIRTVHAFGLEERRISAYYDNLRSPVKWSIIGVLIQGIVAALAQSLIFVMYTVGFAFGAWLMTERLATYDGVYQVFIAVVITSLSLGRAASFAGDLDKAKVAAARLFKLFATVPSIDPTSAAGQKPTKSEGSIVLEKVSFTYPTRPEAPVLQSLNLTIQPGKTVALVGPSGCGKSTVVSLIERFYDAEGDGVGAIKLDGTDIRQINVKWLRSKIGIVSQEPVLFDSSIAENIRYGANDREVTDAEVEAAARDANIHSFITSLPQGYDTNVGSRGTQLSGGQKQRIAIARALVRDPKILLLDEATSALDSESEKVVQEALDRAQQGRTSIVIAHRLSTIQNADLIVVIHDGKVLESGTHSTLMERRGAYYLLKTVQSGNMGVGVSQLRDFSLAADARAQQRSLASGQGAPKQPNPEKEPPRYFELEREPPRYPSPEKELPRNSSPYSDGIGTEV